MQNHRFWSTQPASIGNSNLPIDPTRTNNTERIPLPNGFKFVTLNLTDIDRIHNLLSECYVEDLDSEFRLKYSKEMLQWQFMTPRTKHDYLLGVERDNQLYGFVFATEHSLVINKKKLETISVNYLCVAKDLRNKRLAPSIIKEITRIANTHGIYQAIFTGGIVLPFKLASTQYFHRILDRRELVKSGFCRSGYDETFLGKKYEIHDDFNNLFRPAENNDYFEMFQLFKDESEKHDLHEEMTFEKFKYTLETRNNVIYTFVKKENNIISAFGSFYILDNLAIEKKINLKTAYLYYYTAQNKKELIFELLKYAKKLQCSMFNVINTIEDRQILDELLFCPGDGILNYYLYNWETTPIDKSGVYFYLT